MRRSANIIFNACFALNCLLLFLVFAGKKLAIPAWLQVAGRMHPLVLHFPVVLLVLSVVWFLFLDKKVSAENKKTGDWLLLCTAFASVFTALSGLFLSGEDGYEAGAVQWHKWGGISLSILTAVWYAYRNRIRSANFLRIPVGLIAMFLVVITGHQGAVITHGENFLLAPVTPEKQKPAVLFEDAFVYNDMVKPIFESKCFNCHNSKKAKGGLVMETEALLLKGGKDGKLWDLAEPEFGLLLRRIHLPDAARKHMPPAGKPQLTDEEAQIIYHWIKSGADFKLKVASLPEQDTLHQLAIRYFSTIETDEYTFKAADEKTVESLNTNYRVVRPLAQGSPALGVEFYGAQFFEAKQLEELLKVKEQVVTLNLNKMPVKDDALKTIARFSNLRKLNLSFTSITGKTLKELLFLKQLKQLSVSGTPVTLQDLSSIAGIKSLTHLYCWSTSLQPGDNKKLSVENKNLFIETGFTNDTAVLKLTPPILENEEALITSPVPLLLRHYINGVTIRYTMDGTEPDSIHSPVYDKSILLSGNVTVKAKAFRQGWIASDVMESSFYSAKIQVDSVQNLLPPDEQYRIAGRTALTDLEKDKSTNFKSGKWLGYRLNNMSSVFMFKEPQTVSDVTISSLIDIASYIMPPASIEVWGDTGNGIFRKLKVETPAQPTEIKPAFLKGFELKFPPVKLKAVKVAVQPVGKLPSWHPGKGDKGWIFLDEVFFN